ncbi:rna-directed dna polymerase from mobile element jockey, partial [Lasius niger]
MDSMAVSIHFKNFDFTVVSIYRHPHGPLAPGEYDALFNFCGAFSHVILLGDFNSHHQTWGCPRTDKEGETLLTSALKASYTCLNDGSPTFLTGSSQTGSAIDLTFVSLAMLGLCEWTVLDDAYLSDHFPTAISFNSLAIGRKFFSHKLKHSKTADEQFVTNLHSSLGSLRDLVIDPELSPVQKYDGFVEHLLKQYPSSKAKKGLIRRATIRRDRTSQPAPWWSDACQEAVD